MSDSSMYADTEMHLWKIGNHLECIRDLLGKFLDQQPCPPDTGVAQEIETDSLLFDTRAKKVKYTKSKGLKRTFYSADVKASVLHSVLQCNKTPEAAAEFYGVHLNTLRHWIGAATKGKT